MIYRPLAFLGPESQQAAAAAQCAADQGHFWTYYDIVFQNWNGENQGAYSNDNLERFASALEMDQEAFSTCLRSGRHVNLIRDERRAADELDVNSTPTFFVNGRRLNVRSLDFSEFKTVIDQELVKALR